MDWSSRIARKSATGFDVSAALAAVARSLLIHVANIRDLHAVQRLQRANVGITLAAAADHGNSHPFVSAGRTQFGVGKQRRGRNAEHSLFQKPPARSSSHH